MGGGGGNKEQRFPNGNHTGIYVHLLMEIDLQAQIQNSFSKHPGTASSALQFYSVSLQIYTPPVCV